MSVRVCNLRDNVSLISSFAVIYGRPLISGMLENFCRRSNQIKWIPKIMIKLMRRMCADEMGKTTQLLPEFLRIAASSLGPSLPCNKVASSPTRLKLEIPFLLPVVKIDKRKGDVTFVMIVSPAPFPTFPDASFMAEGGGRYQTGITK